MMTEEEIKKFLGVINEEEEPQPSVIKKVRWPTFNNQSVKLKDRHNYDFIKDVKINVAAELGNTEIKAKEVLTWNVGSIIELNKLAGEAIDLHINEQNMAKGEIIIINDSFGVRIIALNDKSKQKGN